VDEFSIAGVDSSTQTQTQTVAQTVVESVTATVRPIVDEAKEKAEHKARKDKLMAMTFKDSMEFLKACNTEFKLQPKDVSKEVGEYDFTIPKQRVQAWQSVVAVRL
jgi:uncharacterized protein involved in copper resistance